MLMAMVLFQGIKDASMNRWKVCAGYFMQPAVECCVFADKFLDNSIQKQNPCAVSVAASFIPFPVFEAEPQKSEGNGFLPGFRGLELKEALWKA
jgi:hypothetical protein